MTSWLLLRYTSLLPRLDDFAQHPRLVADANDEVELAPARRRRMEIGPVAMKLALRQQQRIGSAGEDLIELGRAAQRQRELGSIRCFESPSGATESVPP